MPQETERSRKRRGYSYSDFPEPDTRDDDSSVDLEMPPEFSVAPFGSRDELTRAIETLVRVVLPKYSVAADPANVRIITNGAAAYYEAMNRRIQPRVARICANAAVVLAIEYRDELAKTSGVRDMVRLRGADVPPLPASVRRFVVSEFVNLATAITPERGRKPGSKNKLTAKDRALIRDVAKSKRVSEKKRSRVAHLLGLDAQDRKAIREECKRQASKWKAALPPQGIWEEAMPVVKATILSTGGGILAAMKEDLTSDAMMRIVEKPPQSQNPVARRTYFRTLTQNLIKDRHRELSRLDNFEPVERLKSKRGHGPD